MLFPPSGYISPPPCIQSPEKSLTANPSALRQILRSDRNRGAMRPNKLTTRTQTTAENLIDFDERNDAGSDNNMTTREPTTRPGVCALHSAVPQHSPLESLCRLYEHLDLPASNESGPQYTYRCVIRTPDRQHLCDNDTQVLAVINSGVFYFDRRKAVCIRFWHLFKTLIATADIVFIVSNRCATRG